MIEVLPVGGKTSKQLPRQILCDMLQPRGEEVLQHIADEMRRVVGNRQLSSGIIVTGGGANLSGITEIGEQIFDAPVRIGFPERDRFGGIIEDVQDPAWTVATGLALFSLKTQTGEIHGNDSKHSSGSGVRGWFNKIRENFGSFF